MLIKDINHKHGAMFSGIYRVTNPSQRTSCQGVPFQVFQLSDMTGILPAYFWLGHIEEPPQINNNSFVEVTGVLREKNENWTATIRSLKILDNTSDNPIRLIPSSWCQKRNYLERLHDICDWLEISSLRRFIFNVLANDNICRQFVTVPASLENHHAYQNGMLEHSIECAEIVRSMPVLERHMAELGVTAALFHDIGKTRTMKECHGYTDVGFLLHHDLLTLEILAPYLSELEKEWQSGALALRYLLSWRNVPFRQQTPLITAAEAVIAADRLSCMSNLEKTAFAGRPDWHRSAKLGTSNRCWRPALPNPTNSQTIRCLAISTATA